MVKPRFKLTLDRPATYQIRVPGHIGERPADWIAGMTTAVEYEAEDVPVTILTGTVDQAALLGLLRRLYSLGLPLISVVCVDADPEGRPAPANGTTRYTRY